MEWTLTIAALVGTLALTVFAGWKSGRKRKDTHRTQWVSWPLVTVFAGAAFFFTLVHAVNLMGFQTGNINQRYGL